MNTTATAAAAAKVAKPKKAKTVSQLATRLLTEYINAEIDPGYGTDNRALASWQVSALSYAVSMNGKSASLDEFLDWYAGSVVRPAQQRYA